MSNTDQDSSDTDSDTENSKLVKYKTTDLEFVEIHPKLCPVAFLDVDPSSTLRGLFFNVPRSIKTKWIWLTNGPHVVMVLEESDIKRNRTQNGSIIIAMDMPMKFLQKIKDFPVVVHIATKHNKWKDIKAQVATQ